MDLKLNMATKFQRQYIQDMLDFGCDVKSKFCRMVLSSRYTMIKHLNFIIAQVY